MKPALAPPKPFLAPLAPGALVYTPATPTFATLANSELGNAGDPSDGFEARFNSTLRALAGADSLIGSIGGAVGAVDTAHAATASIPTADITAAIAAGQAADTAASINLGSAIGALTFDPSAIHGLAPAPTPPTYSVAGIGIGQSATPSGGGAGSLAGPVLAPMIGLAAGEAAAVTLGAGLVTAGTGLATVLGAVAAFAPVVGAFVGLGLLLMQFIGGGCGAPCIEGSKVEQVYEAWADNLLKLYKLGMITKNQAKAGMALATQQGIQHEAQLNTDAARRGSTNLQKVIAAEIADLNIAPAGKRRPFDKAVAHQSYVTGPGWYPDSLAAATQLTDEYVTSLH